MHAIHFYIAIIKYDYDGLHLTGEKKVLFALDTTGGYWRK